MTFVQQISSVGLASVRDRRGDAERALIGYRELLDHWDRYTAWAFQLTTVENLADLLEQLGSVAAAPLRARASPLRQGLSPHGDGMHELVGAARSAIDAELARW